MYNKKNLAVCVLYSERIKGIVYFEEIYNKSNNKLVTKIYGFVKGLTPFQKHGIHIHKYGDLTDGCNSLCEHYNPFNLDHGGRLSKERHVGDLGNLEGDKDGNCEFIFYDKLVKLRGKYSVIGRSLIIHEDEDDLGLGHLPDSLTTGNSGKRIACGIIGFAKPI